MHEVVLHAKPNCSQELPVSISHKINCLFKIRTVSRLLEFSLYKYFPIHFLQELWGSHLCEVLDPFLINMQLP